MLFPKKPLPRSACLASFLTVSVSAHFAASSLALDCSAAEESDETAPMQISLLQRDIHFSKEVMPVDKFDETVVAASLPAAIVDVESGKVMDKVSSLLLEDAEELQQLLELQKLQQAPASPASYRISDSAADPVMLDDLGGVPSEAETKAADLYAQYLKMKAGHTPWTEEIKKMLVAMGAPLSAEEIDANVDAAKKIGSAYAAAAKDAIQTHTTSEEAEAKKSEGAAKEGVGQRRMKEQPNPWTEDVAAWPITPQDKSLKTFHGKVSATVGSLIWVALALLAFCIVLSLLALLWGMVSSWCFDREGEKKSNEEDEKDVLHEVWVRTINGK